MSDTITIKVNTEKLVEVSASVSGQIRKTRTAFEAIDKMVQAAGSYWDGSGHQAFLNAYRRRLSVINESLVRFQENVTDLQEMAGLYVEAEREATDKATTLPNDLII
jgi:uncharacterized protein YukE